jgi:hypothetical protein
MEDFSGLAARVGATVGELRGCLILSRDGLVLGAFPDGDDRLVKPAWLRFAALGEPDKGFVEFGDEIWVYVRRGPYAAFAVVGPGVRPGLVMDQLEQALMTAEELRSKRETMKLPEVPAAPTGKPRTSLHPEMKPTAPEPQPVVVHTELPAAQPSTVAPSPTASSAPAATSAAPAWARPSGETPTAGGGPGSPAESPPAKLEEVPPTSATAPAAAHAAPTPSSESVAETKEVGEEGEAEVDRVMLAQEFSRLLQDGDFRDEE